ncbi:hypothetical protein [Burkholderia pseudomallei]|uniref:hypothetical protein n=2 Tax=Burkholderia pseudomallei TaxID=28450 RepID=UPI0009773E11|nr:hypothetical protein [Burkholderia pseudomallei]
MVFVFFCVSGVLGPMRRHPSMTTREGEPQAIRSLDADVLRMGSSLSSYPGAVIVVGNDWPFYYDVELIRRACSEFGLPVVNVVKTFGGTKENAVVDFMSGRPEPFVVVASQDFEFSENTASQRISVDCQDGFDEAASGSLSEHLRALGEHSLGPLSDDDMRRATVVRYATREVREYISNIRIS